MQQDGNLQAIKTTTDIEDFLRTKSWGTHPVGCEMGREGCRGARIIEGGGNSTAMDQMVRTAVTVKQTRQSTHIFEVVKKSTENEIFHRSTDKLNKHMHFISLLDLHVEIELIAL